MISNVLATDNLYHMKNLNYFKKRLGEEDFDVENLNGGDRSMVYE